MVMQDGEGCQRADRKHRVGNRSLRLDQRVDGRKLAEMEWSDMDIGVR
jgi:hypothetical protein